MEAPTPLPVYARSAARASVGRAPQRHLVRPSDLDREQVLRALKAGSREGRLSLDTLSDRVDFALRARSRAQLDELVSDLPHRRRFSRPLAAAASALSTLTMEVEAAWREARVPRLALPRGRALVTIGRASDCDCVLADETVSRRHALLIRAGDGWMISDLHSTNGTRLNGWRLSERTEVRPGDRVSFGSARFRIVG